MSSVDGEEVNTMDSRVEISGIVRNVHVLDASLSRVLAGISGRARWGSKWELDGNLSAGLLSFARVQYPRAWPESPLTSLSSILI